MSAYSYDEEQTTEKHCFIDTRISAFQYHAVADRRPRSKHGSLKTKQQDIPAVVFGDREGSDRHCAVVFR